LAAIPPAPQVGDRVEARRPGGGQQGVTAARARADDARPAVTRRQDRTAGLL